MNERFAYMLDAVVFLLILVIGIVIQSASLGLVLLAVAIIYSLGAFLKLRCASTKFKILLIVLALIF